jgi:hypothetical protein
MPTFYFVKKQQLGNKTAKFRPNPTGFVNFSTPASYPNPYFLILSISVVLWIFRMRAHIETFPFTSSSAREIILSST